MAVQAQYLTREEETLLKIVSVGLISIVALENLAVATAMPTVVNDLNGHHLYALAMGVVLATQLMTTAIAGPWCDTRGPLPCLFTGIFGFTIGLIVCTFAPSMVFFVIGRAIQGLGAGLCIVPLYKLVGGHIRPSHQPAFFAAFAAAWVVPSLIGPALAGIVVQHTSWRWVFGAVPLMVACALPLLIRSTRSLPPLPAHTETQSEKKRIKMTIVLSILAGISLSILQISSGAKHEDFNVHIYIIVAISACASFAFLGPIFPRGTFLLRHGLASTVAYRGLINGSFLGVDAFLPLVLQEVHGWTPFQAGVVITTGTLTWALGSWAQARIVKEKIRRSIAWIGSLILIVGIGCAALGAFSTFSGLVIILGWLIGGFGIGLSYPAMSVHALQITKPENQGKASSSLQISDTLGAALCVALCGLATAIVPTQELGFFAAFALMALICFISFIAGLRVYPLAGSDQARQLQASLNAEKSIHTSQSE